MEGRHDKKNLTMWYSKVPIEFFQFQCVHCDMFQQDTKRVTMPYCTVTACNMYCDLYVNRERDCSVQRLINSVTGSLEMCADTYK